MSRHDVVVSSSTAVYTDLRQDPHCQEDEVAFLRKEVKRLQDLIHGGQDRRRYRPSASPVCHLIISVMIDNLFHVKSP